MKTVAILLLFAGTALAVPGRNSKCRPAARNTVLVMREDKIVDLTHELNENNTYWPTHPYPFEFTRKFSGYIGDKVFVNNNYFRQPEHYGTHMDSPNHFADGATPINKVSLMDHLIGPGYLINVKEKVERFGPDYLITIQDILKYERKNKARIRTGGIVFFYTGYGEKFYDSAAYLGTNKTGAEAVPFLHFPGLHPEAAKWLVSNRCIGTVGIDAVSIDVGPDAKYSSHIVLSNAGVIIIENVGHLDKLVASGRRFKVIALPPKITDGTGAPLRILAVMSGK